MAFNFNWSPLMADTSRARDMLTAALNKSPKPPIIVDDIIVTELNLGSTPPELEILEVGDLAEDRFRGIFKMSYAGDAFLTLKTKVQANPLNTYLSTKPDFASPQPLAAAASLTIPLQITLSEIRLSGFVILVFSKQKGLTLVFQNDPLESLKVSSTFDSIPFVRDYLQKEIEGQLRILFMEDLPAIIHRLSLRLWSSDYEELETEERLRGPKDNTTPIDPLSTPPQDAVDAFGNALDTSQISALSLDDDVHASFSQKNIKRLAALSESQHTLSLFTPEMREVVYRAWASQSERGESGANTPPLTRSSLARIQSTFGSAKSAGSSVNSDSTGNEAHHSRPSMTPSNSALAGLSLGAGRSRASQMRNRKKRVVDLRKSGDGGDSSGPPTGAANTPDTSTNVSETASIIPEEHEEELATPPRSPPRASHGSQKSGTTDSLLPAAPLAESPPKSSKSKPKSKGAPSTPIREPNSHSGSRPPLSSNRLRPARETTSPLLRSLSFDKVSSLSSDRKKSRKSKEDAESSGGILEQAWMLKMAQEIAKKVQEHKEREAEMDAPPAYTA